MTTTLTKFALLLTTFLVACSNGQTVDGTYLCNEDGANAMASDHWQEVNPETYPGDGTGERMGRTMRVVWPNDVCADMVCNSGVTLHHLEFFPCDSDDY